MRGMSLFKSNKYNDAMKDGSVCFISCDFSAYVATNTQFVALKTSKETYNIFAGC